MECGLCLTFLIAPDNITIYDIPQAGVICWAACQQKLAIAAKGKGRLRAIPITYFLDECGVRHAPDLDIAALSARCEQLPICAKGEIGYTADMPIHRREQMTIMHVPELDDSIAAA